MSRARCTPSCLLALGAAAALTVLIAGSALLAVVAAWLAK